MKPCVAFVLSSLLASAASSAVSQEPKRLRTTVGRRSGGGGGVSPRRVARGPQRRAGSARRLQPDPSLMVSIPYADISGSIEVSGGELGFGPVVVVPTPAPVGSAAIGTLLPTAVLDVEAESSLSTMMSLPASAEDSTTAGPTPAAAGAAPTWPPVLTTWPPVVSTLPPVVSTLPPVAAATPPPVPNLFDTPGTPPPTFAATIAATEMSMPGEVDICMSTSMAEDFASGIPAPTPAPIGTTGSSTSPPIVGEDEEVGTSSTPSPVTPAPVPVPELLPAAQEGSR
jgi:hypothetical protein